jgi:hypothetical protein
VWIWSVTLREEHRPRVFGNRVLGRIFGLKRDEVTRGWRKPRRMRWAGYAACMGVVRNAYKILVGNPKGKRPLGRHRCRWEDNIKIDLRAIGFWHVDWFHLIQDRYWWQALVNTVTNLWVPQNAFQEGLCSMQLVG